MKKSNIFEFNHIDGSLSEEQVETIKEFYKYYHKKHWCYKKACRDLSRVSNMFFITSSVLIAVGTIAGGLTLNPLILGIINGSGIIVAGIAKKKDFRKNIEATKMAYITYEKILVELRSALRGDEWDKDEFINRIKILDELVIDQTPSADAFESKYRKKFNF